MSRELTLNEQVERLFPIGGPYDGDTTGAAAHSISGLVRYLNHATRHAEATPFPDTIDSGIRSLADAVGGLDQLLGQLRGRMNVLVERPEAYATGDDPVATAGGLFALHVDDARGYLQPARHELSSAAGTAAASASTSRTVTNEQAADRRRDARCRRRGTVHGVPGT